MYTDGTCSAKQVASTINRAKNTANESRKDAIINVLGGITGALLVVIILLAVCLIFLTVKYYQDVHAGTTEGGEKATKASMPKNHVTTQTFNSDLIWQISTEENVSYNLMTDHAKTTKNPPSKRLPVPSVNHSQVPTHDSTLKFLKAAGEKKSKKRPPPIPKTAQVADLMQQIEPGPTPKSPPPPATKPTKIADLMKRFEN